MALQLVALALAGAVTVDRFVVWAEIDEAQHFAYVEELAEGGRLPFLGRDTVSEEVLAISRGTYPGPSPVAPADAGLGGQSYEAFQPPLYYLMAVPAFLVAADHLDKVRVLRAFDVLLLLAAAGALWLLARQVFGPNALFPYSAGLAVMLWPGFVVRATTVSNAGLEVLLALLFLAALWRADSRRDRRALFVAGVLLGLALLTKLTLVYLVPVYAWALVRELRRPGRRPALLAVAALVPALMIAPWVASNLDRYGSLTANEQARELQVPFLYGSEPDFGPGDLPGKAPHLLDGFLPQEWDEREGLAAITVITTLLKLALFAAPLALLVLEPARLRSREFALLVLPALLAALTVAATLLTADWDLFLGRYLYPVLPPLALFAALAWRQLLRSERAALAATVAVSAAVAALWADAALAFYFTDLGDSLGFD